MKKGLIFSVYLLFSISTGLSTAADQPNVLFIAIDDLNDWVGVFGGHPEAKTPHLDQLAAEGGMVFHNAHCPGPVCGPSRSALLSGFMPHRSGIYGNSNNMLDSELVQTHATLPEYFSRNGYLTLSRGKIAHKHATPNGFDQGHWMYERWANASGGTGVDPTTLTSRDKNIINGQPGPPSKFTKSGGSEFAWGMTREGTEKTKDYITAQWAAEQLKKEHTKPFFLAIGIAKPHLPFYSPKEFWDLYPPGKSYAPEVKENDFNDILLPNGKQGGSKSQDYLWIEQNNLQNEAARAYLACASYADHCTGVILNALKESVYANNTIVVVWGDHGWHLGEKLRYRKAELWTESTRCPLIVRLPNSTVSKQCHSPVNLIDLYPTLIELCSLPKKSNIDGRSFAPLLKNPDQNWHPTLTIRGPKSVAIHDDTFNLIHRKNGVRELYHLTNDPMEWQNLHGNPKFSADQNRLQKHLPKTYASPLPNRPKNKQRKTLDESIRPKRLVSRLQ